MDLLSKTISKFAKNHEQQQSHVNIDAIQLLGNADSVVESIGRDLSNWLTWLNAAKSEKKAES